MENINSSQSFSSPSPPVSDDSIFFNLILGTNYENTKENCLQFLKNYSKYIFFPKREIFKMLINELTLNENSNKVIGTNESIYLLRQLIKKYSRNNILNAIYDFISEKEYDFISPANENNLINSTDDSSMNKLLYSQSEKDSKCELDLLKKTQVKKNEEEDEKQELIKQNGNINHQLLSKKRKLNSSKKGMKKNKEKNKSKEKRKKYPVKKKFRIKKQIIKKKNENEEKKKEELEKQEKSEEKEKEIDSVRRTNEIKKEEKEVEIGQKQVNIANKKEEENDKMEEEEVNEDNYKNKLRKKLINKSKSDNNLTSKKSKKIIFSNIKEKRLLSAQKEILLENSEKASLYNSVKMPILENLKFKTIKDKNQHDILSYFSPKKDNSFNSHKKVSNGVKYSCHLIKNPKDKNCAYSYKIKRYQGKLNQTIIFECNNKKCKAMGEYDIDKRIFTEKVSHNIAASSHKICSIFNNIRDILLKDPDCDGYQILKDGYYIKDKEIIFINIS